MLEPSQVPMEVAPDEEVGRRVRSKRHRSLRDHSLHKNLFVPEPGTDASVDRLTIASNYEETQELIELAKRQCAERGRNFYGWGVLTAAEVSQNEGTVVASPQDDNPYHADIVLPEKVAHDPIAIGRHAQELADAARFREISSSSP